MELRLSENEVGRGSELRRERAGISGRHAAGELDRGVGGKRGAQLLARLVEELVAEHAAEPVLPGLGEEVVDVLVEVLGGFVDDEKGRPAVMLGNGGPLEDRVEDERYEKPPEMPRGALEEVLGGVDEDDGARLSSVNRSTLVWVAVKSRARVGFSRMAFRRYRICSLVCLKVAALKSRSKNSRGIGGSRSIAAA